MLFDIYYEIYDIVCNKYMECAYHITCALCAKNKNRPKKCFVIVLNLMFSKVSEGKKT